MKKISCATVFFLVSALAAVAQHAPVNKDEQASGGMMPHESHQAGVSVSFAELKNTVALLERARQATAKYQDLHVAEAEGYRQVGGDHPGMGIHYVLTLEPKEFDVEKPPILVYEKNPAAPSGYSLAGVAYLWNGPAGPDGQPLDAPFPKALAHWHRHANVCMAPGIANPGALTEQQCHEHGGQFVANTPWMVHAWIWKDSRPSVFSE